MDKAFSAKSGLHRYNTLKYGKNLKVIADATLDAFGILFNAIIQCHIVLMTISSATPPKMQPYILFLYVLFTIFLV